jgi:hypothetical protein
MPIFIPGRRNAVGFHVYIARYIYAHALSELVPDPNLRTSRTSLFYHIFNLSFHSQVATAYKFLHHVQ